MSDKPILSQEPLRDDLGAAGQAQFSGETPTGEIAAWTEIEDGRFMPRRTRGSFQGRALG